MHTVTTILPTDEQLANHLKLSLGEALGENIHFPLLGTNVLGDHSLGLANLAAEEVVLEGQILVPRGHLGDIDKRQATLVVFEDSRSHESVLDKSHVQLGTNLLEESTHG